MPVIDEANCEGCAMIINRVNQYPLQAHSGRRNTCSKGVKVVVKFFLLAIIAVYCSAKPVFGKEISPEATIEIDQLLHYIENSTCLFLRNGSWHGSRDAANHIMSKYRYFVDRGQISSTEDFIEKSATRSSLTGKLYLVKCGAEELSSAEWLRLELARLRSLDSKRTQ